MSTCRRPEQSGRGIFEEDAPVAHEAARAALLHFGVGIAVEPDVQAQPRGLLPRPGQDRGVTPVAQDQVGIVPREQMLERNRGGLARFVEAQTGGRPLPRFLRAPHIVQKARRGVGSTRRSPPRRTRRISSGRQLVVQRPFAVSRHSSARTRPSPSTSAFDARQGKNAALPAVERREHQVAVVKPQRGIEIARPARP